MAEHNAQKGEIWLSETIYPFISGYLQETAGSELYGLKFYKAVRTGRINPLITQYAATEFDKKYIYRLSGKLESEFPVGEFRDIISVFISFEGDGILEKLMKLLYELKETYGASHPVLDFGDKGGNILLFFGAPISYENNAFRALTFTLKLFEESEGYGLKLRAGLAKGVVYCGFNGSDLRNEFTCLGNTVNQSARFMMKAEWGQILTDRELSMSEGFVSEHLADMLYKGREGFIPTFILKAKAEVKDIFFKGNFIGREKEKEKLRKFITPLFSGKNRGAIYIDGEPGIGKSRLTNQIRQEFTKEKDTTESKMNWFYFSCEEIIREPYNPFKYFFHRFFDFEENSDLLNAEKYENKLNKILSQIKSKDIRDDLQKYRDYLSYFLGLKVSNTDILVEEPNERQNSVTLSLIYFFKTFCEYSPLVFEVDNAGYLDSDSLKLYSRLAIALNKCQFAIIFNCRYKDNGGAYDFGFVKKKRVQVKPLNKSEFKELVKDRLKLKTVPKETISALDDKSRRNPLFLEQMVIYIKENKVLDSKNRIIDVSSLPNGINQIILARIDKLESNLKELLKTAACIGNEIPVDLLSYLFRSKYKNIEKFLVELENEDIIILFTEISYLFKFGVIRDVIYDIQLKKILRDIHEQIGLAIEKIHADSLDKYYPVLAYHFENAENLEKAYNYHWKAGLKTKADYQNTQAVIHFDKASKLLSDAYDRRTENWKIIDGSNKHEAEKFIKINLDRFYFYFAILQDINKSSEIIEKICSVAENLGDEFLISQTMLEQSLILANRGDYEKSNSTILNAMEILKKLNLPNKLAIACINLGKNHIMTGQMDKALEYCNTGLSYASEIDIDYERQKINAKIFGDMGIVYDYSGNFDKALEFYSKQLEITEKLNLKIEKALALGNIGVVYHLTGNLNKAKEYYEQKLKISEELGRRLEFAQILNNLGFLFKDQNNLVKAIKFHKKSYAISSELNDHSTMASASVNLGHVYKIQNNFQKAEIEYKKCIDISEKFALKHNSAEGMVELGEVYYLMDRKDEALKSFQEGYSIAKEIGFEEYIEKGKSQLKKYFFKKT
jgi:predicted ATPase